MDNKGEGMTEHPLENQEERRANRWLRASGITAIAAAALGSILIATPAMPESPAPDTHCQGRVMAGGWLFQGCGEDAPHP